MGSEQLPRRPRWAVGPGSLAALCAVVVAVLLARRCEGTTATPSLTPTGSVTTTPEIPDPGVPPEDGYRIILLYNVTVLSRNEVPWALQDRVKLACNSTYASSTATFDFRDVSENIERATATITVAQTALCVIEDINSATVPGMRVSDLRYDYWEVTVTEEVVETTAPTVPISPTATEEPETQVQERRAEVRAEPPSSASPAVGIAVYYNRTTTDRRQVSNLLFDGLKAACDADYPAAPTVSASYRVSAQVERLHTEITTSDVAACLVNQIFLGSITGLVAADWAESRVPPPAPEPSSSSFSSTIDLTPEPSSTTTEVPTTTIEPTPAPTTLPPMTEGSVYVYYNTTVTPRRSVVGIVSDCAKTHCGATDNATAGSVSNLYTNAELAQLTVFDANCTAEKLNTLYTEVVLFAALSQPAAATAAPDPGSASRFSVVFYANESFVTRTDRQNLLDKISDDCSSPVITFSSTAKVSPMIDWSFSSPLSQNSAACMACMINTGAFPGFLLAEFRGRRTDGRSNDAREGIAACTVLQSTGREKLTRGRIAGIVVGSVIGGLLLVAAIGLIVYIICRNRREARMEAENDKLFSLNDQYEVDVSGMR